MNPVIILVLFVYYADARVTTGKCDGVIVHNINHEKEILKSDIGSPYQLAIDFDTNTLFFSYSTNSGSSTFESAYINLKNNEFNIIKGIEGGFANAVDEQKHIVYLGGRDGIYTFDYESKRATHVDGTSHNIWQLFYKNKLYYSKYPEEEVYVFTDGESQRLPELKGTKGMLVAVDNSDNIYFSNSSGLFIYKRAKQYIFYIGDYNINGFTSDIDGNLYFSTPSGIYYINDKNKKVEKLASIDDVYGVAVESDGNIIYASGDSLIRLKPTKTYCYVNEKEILREMKY